MRLMNQYFPHMELNVIVTAEVKMKKAELFYRNRAAQHMLGRPKQT
jgi:hypothetical protein